MLKICRYNPASTGCMPMNESLAEGVGFEPTRERKPPAGFQDRCLKPLGHPSVSGKSITYDLPR